MNHEQFLSQHLSEMVTEATKGVANGAISTLASIMSLEGICSALSDEERKAFYSGMSDITGSLLRKLEQIREEAGE